MQLYRFLTKEWQQNIFASSRHQKFRYFRNFKFTINGFVNGNFIVFEWMNNEFPRLVFRFLYFMSFSSTINLSLSAIYVLPLENFSQSLDSQLFHKFAIDRIDLIFVQVPFEFIFQLFVLFDNQSIVWTTVSDWNFHLFELFQYSLHAKERNPKIDKVKKFEIYLSNCQSVSYDWHTN